MGNTQGKGWTAPEVSVLYHLVMWGYTNLQIRNHAEKFLDRTSSAISSESSEVRKWVSSQLGFRVWDIPIADKKLKLYEKASSIPAGPELLVFKTDKNPKPSTMQSSRSKPVYTGATTQSPEEMMQEFRAQPMQIITKEPDILDVMKMAKELGASEVEYKGMKIKY